MPTVGGNKPRTLTGMHIQIDSCQSLALVSLVMRYFTVPSWNDDLYLHWIPLVYILVVQVTLGQISHMVSSNIVDTANDLSPGHGFHCYVKLRLRVYHVCI